jgi:hypothetical protein
MVLKDLSDLKIFEQVTLGELARPRLKFLTHRDTPWI